VLQNARAEYGKEIVATLSQQLTEEYGRGFDRRNLHYMVRFAELFPDEQIVNALRSQLSWTHFREPLSIQEPLKREFYAEMCRVECWSTPTLQQKISHLLFEHTAVAKKPAELIADDIATLRDDDRLTPDMVFRDPYFLDFLGLTGYHAEQDVEDAILRELEAFILELGTDFAFVARQKRITIDNEDYYIDLLFYHQRLRCLVAIDLKLGKFQAADKGQMELYLRWLERHDVQPGEAAPPGLILCAEKSAEHVELPRLEDSGIRVAQYLTELPSRQLLRRKLHDAVLLARERLAKQEQRKRDDKLAGGKPASVAGQKKRRKIQSFDQTCHRLRSSSSAGVVLMDRFQRNYLRLMARDVVTGTQDVNRKQKEKFLADSIETFSDDARE